MRSRFALTVVATLSFLSLSAAACGSSASSSGAADSGSVSKVSVEVGDNADKTQFLTPSTDTVNSGEVEFTLTNTGKVDHEMVVLKTDTPFDQLAVGTDNRVDETDSVGEIGETKPGETATVTLFLAPGKYVLVCNIAGHYAMGMRAPFTVQ
jgi:uncharacterized cupredoxin-like copper-binding protein